MRYNLDLPEERLRCCEERGHEEYNRLHEEHLTRQIVATVNGHDIRQVRTERWGLVYMIGTTNNAAMRLETAKASASKLPRGRSKR